MLYFEGFASNQPQVALDIVLIIVGPSKLKEKGL